MNLWDYVDHLSDCVYGCSGEVRTCDPLVFEGDQQALFDAIVDFPGGYKLCVSMHVELDEDGSARPWLYSFHFQGKAGKLIERWDCDPNKDPQYHRHKPPNPRKKIPDVPRELEEVIQMVWADFMS